MTQFVGARAESPLYRRTDIPVCPRREAAERRRSNGSVLPMHGEGISPRLSLLHRVRKRQKRPRSRCIGIASLPRNDVPGRLNRQAHKSSDPRAPSFGKPSGASCRRGFSLDGCRSPLLCNRPRLQPWYPGRPSCAPARFNGLLSVGFSRWSGKGVETPWGSAIVRGKPWLRPWPVTRQQQKAPLPDESGAADVTLRDARECHSEECRHVGMTKNLVTNTCRATQARRTSDCLAGVLVVRRTALRHSRPDSSVRSE